MPWRSHWATRVTVAVEVGTRSAISRYGHALLEQEGRLPPVRQRLELGQRAEVAEEAPRLVARAQERTASASVVETGDGLDGLPGLPGVIDRGAMRLC